MQVSDSFAQLASLPGVTEAVEEARDSVDRLLGHRILRRRSAEVSAESALRGARASAALDGISVPLEEFRDGSVDDAEVQGALRISAELGSLTDVWRNAPRQVLARLHVLAAADAVPAAELGRPRASDVSSEVAARLDALSTLLTAETAAPAVIVAAIVHGELLVLRPFGWGDGLIARAAARLTLVDRGLDPKSLVTPEVGHVELGDAYADSLRGYVSGTPVGVGGWIRHCAQATALGARDSLAVCEAFQRG
jgi:hypothetical protein